MERLAATAALRRHSDDAPRQRAVDLEHALTAHSNLIFGLQQSLADVLKPLQQLQSLVEFEAMRQDQNPLLPTLASCMNDISTALAANGIAQSGATVGEPFDEERHERAARGGIVPADDNLLDDFVIKEVVRPGYVHSATGAVIIRALVHTSSASGGGKRIVAAASSSAPPVETPRGTRMHQVMAGDTLQGLALRYGCQPAALMRLNRLPNAHALHARKMLRLPPPSRALATGHAAQDVSEPLWGGGGPYLTAGDGGAVLVAGDGNDAGGRAKDGASGGGGATSMAARIAARRQASFERRRALDGSSAGSMREDGDDGGGTGGIDGSTAEPAAEHVAEVERALLAAKRYQQHRHQRQQHEQQGGANSAPGADDPIVFGIGSQRSVLHANACADWLHEQISPSLAGVVANALMQPWRAIASAAESADDEMVFMRSLAEHASEASVLALLEGAKGADGDGDVLRQAAAAVWQSMRSLRSSSDGGGGATVGEFRSLAIIPSTLQERTQPAGIFVQLAGATKNSEGASHGLLCAPDAKGSTPYAANV